MIWTDAFIPTRDPALDYGTLTPVQTWVCTVAMLLGRLELLSVLVLFTAQFWRR